MLERDPGFLILWKGINPTVTYPTWLSWFYLLASLPVTRITDEEKVDTHMKSQCILLGSGREGGQKLDAFSLPLP